MRITQTSLVLLFVALAAGCSRTTTITVSNESRGTISNITIAATGFKESIPLLTNGSTRSFEFELKGDSSLEISYEAGGRRIVSGKQAYLMANQRQTALFRIGTNDSIALKIHQPTF